MIRVLRVIYFSLFLSFGYSQNHPVQSAIEEMIKSYDATVGVSIYEPKSGDQISVNGDRHLPMQSVYKLHLALTVLKDVDAGICSLSDSIQITPAHIEQYEHLWSPLKKKYPNGATITIAEMMEQTVAWSDNMGCDILFEMVGGPAIVEKYMRDIGITDVAIRYPEIIMQSDWEIQYLNWSTADAITLLLQKIYTNENKMLSETSYDYLMETLIGTQTGTKSLRGLLPEGTTIAHKTGQAGVDPDGKRGAVNDVGIIFLPDGSPLYISVLVSDSREKLDDCYHIIAQTARIAWDHYILQ